jgi:hypothetical protein
MANVTNLVREIAPKKQNKKVREILPLFFKNETETTLAQEEFASRSYCLYIIPVLVGSSQSIFASLLPSSNTNSDVRPVPHQQQFAWRR